MEETGTGNNCQTRKSAVRVEGALRSLCNLLGPVYNAFGVIVLEGLLPCRRLTHLTERLADGGTAAVTTRTRRKVLWGDDGSA